MKPLEEIQKRLFDVEPYRMCDIDGIRGKVYYHEQGRKQLLYVVVSVDGGYVEHVSVSTKKRTPTWEEMCFVKDICFADEELVIQFHPKKSEYVNFHPYTLHMWRPVKGKEADFLSWN